ncbi:MAG TPA: hypothetical protein EYQ35_01495 [candidate division UBP10 bacterium]|nr:hypothetical protein [Candidatus Binatota bacterium]
MIRPSWGVSRRFLAYTCGLLLLAGLAGGLLAWRFYLQTDELLTGHFAGQRWDFPSRIYSDQYAVYPGLGVDGELFAWRLKRRGYVAVRDRPKARGEYRYVAAGGEPGQPRRLELFLRSFDFPGRREAGRLLDIRLDAGGRILGMHEGTGGEEIYSFFLEPVMLAGLHGELREDRREMKIAEVPAPLVRAVVSVEDRRFFEHRGVDLRGLARAFLVNLRSGRVRQGGSTLTQQLMKNFFLDNERTLTRKAREAVMAVMAERRFSKLEILENYLNEIYLGQKGGVGVHGLGLVLRPRTAGALAGAGGYAGRRHSGAQLLLAPPPSRARHRAPQRRAAGATRRGRDRPPYLSQGPGRAPGNRAAGCGYG